MTTYPILIPFVSVRFKGNLQRNVFLFNELIGKMQQKPEQLQKLTKTLGKKMHVKFTNSQRVAIQKLVQWACDPMSSRFSHLRKIFGLEKTKVNNIPSFINSLFVIISCFNLGERMIGMHVKGTFKNFSQSYLAALGGCHKHTIYRHMKKIEKAGLMKQRSMNSKEDFSKYRTSAKIVFERMFFILGVTESQFQDDHLYCFKKNQTVAVVEKPQPKPPVATEDPFNDTDVDPEIARDVIREHKEECERLGIDRRSSYGKVLFHKLLHE